ncbi:MAG: hypothetical protein J6V25_10755, partial [Oscillospiraceae bacterium]|nr:hypothetical protein [Oscillospiraceae bacterium]
GSRPISTEVVLKHGFAPMEQYNSHGNLGPWTDVYALCASCYYCLTGKCPQDAPSRVDQGETLTELYKNPSIGRELIQTLEQGMTIRIQDRIQSVAQLQKKLCQPPKRKRNKKWLTIAAAAVTAVSLMAGGVAAMGSRELAPVSDPVQNQPPQMQFTDAPDHPAATTAAVQTEPKQSVQSQRSVVAVAAGLDHTVVLLSDGTVQATGANQYGQCDVEDWQDIVQISVLKDHTVGLCADGTVVAVGDNGQGQCDVAHWDNIIAVAAGGHHTVGLRSDGTVVTAGEDWYGEGELYSWCDVTAIAAGYSNTYGLCKDGTVLVSGSYKKGKITGWNNITAIAASDSHVVGLCADGTAKGVGTNSENQCDLEHWNNMVSVSAGCGFSVGLRADGKVLVQGINDQNQHGAAQWTDVAFLSCGLEHVVAVRKDGLLVAVGANDEGQCAVSKWNSN